MSTSPTGKFTTDVCIIVNVIGGYSHVTQNCGCVAPLHGYSILCSRWWCDRGSPVFTQRHDAPTPEGRSGPLVQIPQLAQSPLGRKDGLTAYRHTLPSSYLQPNLQQHQPHLWPALRGMGQMCRKMWHPKLGLGHISMVLLLKHLVLHQIDKYQMVPVGHGLQLWPVTARSARWLLYDGDANIGSWDS